jgi:hypothetical protein
MSEALSCRSEDFTPIRNDVDRKAEGIKALMQIKLHVAKK